MEDSQYQSLSDNNNNPERSVDTLRFISTTLPRESELFNESPLNNNDNSRTLLSSRKTILAIWNSMVGSSICSIPYVVLRAGIIPTIFLSIFYGFISYFTCSIVVRRSKGEDDFARVVNWYLKKVSGNKLGKVGYYLQLIFNLLINIGAALVYFLIINQNLYPFICFILTKCGVKVEGDNQEPDFKRFSIIYCSLCFALIIFPFTIMKDLGILMKLNSYGVYGVIIIVLYIVYNFINSLTNTNYHFAYKSNKEGDKDRYLLLFGEEPSLLAGTLSLGLFIHSLILPLLKNNKIQKNNNRDLKIGYILVVLTFILVGIFGYVGFSGSNYKPVFEDNWFRFFKSDNILIFIIRLVSIAQMTLIFPCIFHIIRKQLLETFYGNEYPNTITAVIFSICILSICLIVLYFCHSILAKLIGIVGATTAMVLIYTTPILVNMIHNYFYKNYDINVNFNEIKNISDVMSVSTNNENNKEINKNSNNENNNENDDLNVSNEIDDNNNNHQENNDNNIPETNPYINNSNTESNNDNYENNCCYKFKAFLFYFCHVFIFLLGIFTFVMQFVKINFFRVKIKD